TIPRPAPTDGARQALRRELELSAQAKGVPGTDLAFNDAPEK
ncbi:MAG: serine hydrolase, partial [Variovorax sp.]|nr:serine hydrolase [Variovorax sp.]